MRLPVEPEAEDGGYGWTPRLSDAVAARIGIADGTLPAERLTVVRRSLDARPPARDATSRSVHWSYVVDVELDRKVAASLRIQPGRLVPAAPERARFCMSAQRACFLIMIALWIPAASPMAAAMEILWTW